jgi:hypothetical protein
LAGYAWRSHAGRRGKRVRPSLSHAKAYSDPI